MSKGRHQATSTGPAKAVNQLDRRNEDPESPRFHVAGRKYLAVNGVELHICRRVEATPQSPARDVRVADFGAARAVLVKANRIDDAG